MRDRGRDRDDDEVADDLDRQIDREDDLDREIDLEDEDEREVEVAEFDDDNDVEEVVRNAKRITNREQPFSRACARVTRGAGKNRVTSRHFGPGQEWNRIGGY